MRERGCACMHALACAIACVRVPRREGVSTCGWQLWRRRASVCTHARLPLGPCQLPSPPLARSARVLPRHSPVAPPLCAPGWLLLQGEGMPIHGRPYEKGNLYIHFTGARLHGVLASASALGCQSCCCRRCCCCACGAPTHPCPPQCMHVRATTTTTHIHTPHQHACSPAAEVPDQVDAEPHSHTHTLTTHPHTHHTHLLACSGVP